MHQREVGPRGIYGLEMEARGEATRHQPGGDLPCGKQVGRPW